MKLTVSQSATEAQRQSVFISEGANARFAVPVRFGVRRELPSSPGRYLILLRQRHRVRINRPWRWGRFVGEM